jgi:superfamily II DNA/RNA helicase
MERQEQMLEIQHQDPIIYSKNNIFYCGDVGVPLRRIENVGFEANIRKNFFTKRYLSIFPLQCYSWNEILDGKSVAMISPRDSGKTIGYLPSLLSHLANGIKSREASKPEENDEGERQIDIGPTAIIFVKTSREIQLIKQLCTQLMTSPKLEIVTAAGIWNLKKKVLALINGCDLLITTPPCFERLADCGAVNIFDRDKIRYLVFENLNGLQEKFEGEIERIFKRFVEHAPAEDSQVQLIITATKWVESLRSLYKQSYINVLLISDFIEAAIMARSRFQVVVEKEESKDANLLDRLKKYEWSHQKTLIIFDKISEIIEFRKLLETEAPEINFVAVDSNEKSDLTKSMISLWQREPRWRMTLLLMNDEVFQRLFAEIEHVEVIIHYSMTKTWTKFSRRFAASIEIYKQHVELPSEMKRPTAIILLCDENIREFSSLHKFLQDRRLFKQLSDEIQQKVQIIKDGIEENKMMECSGVQLCPNFLKFADDSNVCKCELRHAFTLKDRASLLPRSGQVKFKILCVLNPLHFSIQITHTRVNAKSKWVSHLDKIKQTEWALQKLQQFMNDNENVKTAAVIKIGEVYCARHSITHEWCRCRVIAIS